MAAHRDRYSTTGVSLRKAGVVIHDSETGDGSALNLIAAMQRPGDRLIAGAFLAAVAVTLESVSHRRW